MNDDQVTLMVTAKIENVTCPDNKLISRITGPIRVFFIQANVSTADEYGISNKISIDCAKPVRRSTPQTLTANKPIDTVLLWKKLQETENISS